MLWAGLLLGTSQIWSHLTLMATLHVAAGDLFTKMGTHTWALNIPMIVSVKNFLGGGGLITVLAGQKHQSSA
jgi:hypothetical protein